MHVFMGVFVIVSFKNRKYRMKCAKILAALSLGGGIIGNIYFLFYTFIYFPPKDQYMFFLPFPYWTGLLF